MPNKDSHSGIKTHSWLACDAMDRNFLMCDATSEVYDTVRIIPHEDDGSHNGPVIVGARTRIRDGVLIGSGVKIGDDTAIGNNAIIRTNVIIGGGTVISHGTVVERGSQIGSNVRMSGLTYIAGSTLIEDDVQMGARVVVVNHKHMHWRERPEIAPAILRRGCKIGSGSVIMAGVEIGENTFVGAGAVVTKSLPANVVALGVPAAIQV